MSIKSEKIPQTLNHLIDHIILMVLIGILTYTVTKSIQTSILLSILNISLDFDHLIEYFLWSGGRFVFCDFFLGKYFGKKRKSFLFFHCWEYVLISLSLWLISHNIILLLFSISISSHLIFDLYTYKSSPIFYSFIYRLYFGFESDKICTKRNST